MWMWAGRHGWRPVASSIAPDRPVIGDRIRHRAHGDERVTAVVRVMNRPRRWSSGASGRCTAYRRSSPFCHTSSSAPAIGCAVDVAAPVRGRAPAPRRLLGDVVAVLAQRRAGNVERAQHGRLGRAGGQRVLERVDEHRQAERVRPQHPLLAALVGDLARCGSGSRSPAAIPPGSARPRATKRVRVTDERLHQLAQPRVGAARRSSPITAAVICSGVVGRVRASSSAYSRRCPAGRDPPPAIMGRWHELAWGWRRLWRRCAMLACGCGGSGADRADDPAASQARGRVRRRAAAIPAARSRCPAGPDRATRRERGRGPGDHRPGPMRCATATCARRPRCSSCPAS